MATNWRDFKKSITTLDSDTMTAIDTLADLVSMRVQANITQKEFAERIGMKQPQLAKLEQLDSVPTMQTLNRYAQGLGYKVTLTLVKDKQA